MNSPVKKRVRVPVHGVLLLDKPVGLSSNDALIKAKRLFNAQKAGHTGTLDPFATGLLPLCFGEATKFSQDLLEADKTYQTTVHLGVSTTTGDTEGEIVESLSVNVTEEQIHAALAQFRGDILQTPPMYSALKRDGKPLYEYARAGITLEREARPVTIHSLDFVSYDAPYLTLNVCCSKGTYIRVLGEDIGKVLSCGAHLKALRRTQVGHLILEKSITLEALGEIEETDRLALLAPVDALLSSFPRLDLTEELAKRFLQGQRLALGKESTILPTQIGRVRVYRASDQQLLGSAQLQEYSILAPERLIATTMM
ncbi:tRNA pseudouridine(55) synthase TruB [Undibacterium sp. RTI2.1]|uniref:tRNA pseudouridine(55) synthase TruB n=1 Tax=unclassified Undibacterium TaxID=2630295 RepID=UPI002AB47EA4|nr:MULTISPECIES: tRNA pseudouridine(55) synthase TruB [unclassified Undibacterium]MDY7538619.1 tRNA pseudouridine(55) synthase TruB [Undibacterium sp. 5I1]MEB0032705.1 tRNA pseudouridine(55) synthase TruB [Undibacterium sp. RTI2.1]MEB0116299.1 tRNA pseudouridine(55) synthase TruB [Undibacterium sp. RTI2.2]MEB0231462.1 tRNA pseudouridine(55) synthase TruB [Undibacterium sp. 10I3]MEB0258121.1 tRNA pseudouridine(55) synthase TruB [Undibacterium sp. 5I1]